MNTLKLALFTLVLGSAGSMAADCSRPEAPTVPKGAESSMEDMLAGQKAVKVFQTENIEYMKCLEAAFTAAESATKEGTDEEKAAAQEAYSKAVDAYNAAVSKEEEVAGQFNTEIREYKAANPG